jgi:hypothetical protein
MQKTIKFLPYLMIAGILSSFTSTFASDGDKRPGDKSFPSLLSNSTQSPAFKQVTDSIYDEIGLLSYGLEKDVFYNAYKGYQHLLKQGRLTKTHLLTICDYSQSSNNQRLYVIDLYEGRVLYNTFVSHGKNSGEEFATSFSNLQNSNKSSLGFMVTAETYNGKAGYSMRFDGAERGINDRVRSRDIVLHGSQFVSRSLMGGGMISKSLGCPAVPYGVHKSIINTIKGGSCFFINHPDQWYSRTSPILNAPVDFMIDLNNVALEKSQHGGGGNGGPSVSTIIQPQLQK